MKRQRIILSVLMGISFLAAMPQRVFAQRILDIDNPVVFDSLEEVINYFLGLIRPVIILVMVASIMYGGWIYLTAGSDDKKVGQARQIITAAIVGFIIIVLAPVIVQFVGSLLGVRDGVVDLPNQT